MLPRLAARAYPRRRPSARRAFSIVALRLRRRRTGSAPSTATLLSVNGRITGLYRVSDPTLDRYEIFRGVDGAAIDFDAAPWHTAASLPATFAAPAAAHRYEFVVRKRSAYNASSQNKDAHLLDLDGSGNERAVPPSDPTEAGIAAAAGAFTLVRASYTYEPDGDDQADTWVVYLRSNGTDPDPTIDTPYTEAMSTVDGTARLAYSAGPFGEGDDVRVIVRTRRGGTPDVDSTNDDVYTATATFVGPDAVDGVALYGGVDAQA